MAKKLGQTKKISTTGVISTANKSALVWAITLLAGTTLSSIIIKDGGTGGTEKWKISNDGVTVAEDATVSVSFKQPIVCAIDAFGTIAGTNAVAYILYDEIEA
ncbi:hypothetical protein LCGC14_1429660 [marine sediment metagenome]|uniref:Uncharacterized protein n=1 Tax=marine sediment metagenome TaxID=412755 RepID=A0A0F9JNY9_9ZZZZ